MTTMDLEITIDLSCAGGIFAHDIDATVTIDYEVERFPRSRPVITGWSLVDIRFPNMAGEITNRDWLWPLFKQAVDDQRAWVEEKIIDHAEDDDGSDYARDMRLGNFEPAANLIGVK